MRCLSPEKLLESDAVWPRALVELGVTGRAAGAAGAAASPGCCGLRRALALPGERQSARGPPVLAVRKRQCVCVLVKKEAAAFVFPCRSAAVAGFAVAVQVSVSRLWWCPGLFGNCADAHFCV